MKLIQAKGNTWYLEDNMLIPLYKTDEKHCILLDSGLISQREAIEETLQKHGVTPVGIVGSHAHTDHSPNHWYFKKKYQIPVALSLGEASISSNPLMLKAYYYMLSPGQMMSFPEYSEMLFEVDRIIMPGEDHLSFCGAEFEIIRTSGHSPDHIAIGTPDDVLYLGDAVLAGKSLTESKLPYFFSIETAIRTMRNLDEASYSCYLMAHKGICEKEAFQGLLEQNIETLQTVTDRLCRMIDRPMTISEAIGVICGNLSLLSSRVLRSTYYERNIRTYLEYMVDTQMIEAFSERGVTCLRPFE